MTTDLAASGRTRITDRMVARWADVPRPPGSMTPRTIALELVRLDEITANEGTPGARYLTVRRAALREKLK